MVIVQMDIKEYEASKDRQKASDKKIQHLLDNEKDAEERRKKEMWELIEQEKILYVVQGADGDLTTNVKGFNELKDTVTEQVKNHLFDDEIQKRSEEAIRQWQDNYHELAIDYDTLYERYDKLRNRNFFERLFNKDFK